jgi:hypothetical protein
MRKRAPYEIGTPPFGRLRMRRHQNVFCALALVCALGGCSANGAVNTPSPLPVAKVAATPIGGKTSIVAVPANPVGNVQPVYVSIANGTGNPMLESSGEIFALGADGNRVPALPPQEAANQAGGSRGSPRVWKPRRLTLHLRPLGERPLPPSDLQSREGAYSAAAS